MHELAGIEDGYLKVASDSIVFERDEFDGTAEGLRHEESTQCPVIPLVASATSELHLEPDPGGHDRFGGGLFFRSLLVVVGQAVEGVVRCCH
mmetsp:Transcript_12411/g.20653  ORF Transcript_12411/g.20653 Transcript_12411/m.20653 type:complete len:92 (-) Transcript_12411:13-288(-)